MFSDPGEVKRNYHYSTVRSEAASVAWVFVSSPEVAPADREDGTPDWSAEKKVMDHLEELCKAYPENFYQGFDWASSGNSYPEDGPWWTEMGSIRNREGLQGQWVDAGRTEFAFESTVDMQARQSNDENLTLTAFQTDYHGQKIPKLEVWTDEFLQKELKRLTGDNEAIQEAEILQEKLERLKQDHEAIQGGYKAIQEAAVAGENLQKTVKRLKRDHEAIQNAVDLQQKLKRLTGNNEAIQEAVKAEVIALMAPILERTQWFKSYRGKVQGALQAACQKSKFTYTCPDCRKTRETGRCKAVLVAGGPVSRVEHYMMEKICKNVNVRGFEIRLKDVGIKSFDTVEEMLHVATDQIRNV